MLKQLLAVLLVFILAFAFAACGFKGKDKKDKNKTTGPVQTEVRAVTQIINHDGVDYVVVPGRVPTRTEGGSAFLDFDAMPTLARGENAKGSKGASAGGNDNGKPERTKIVNHGDHTHIVVVDE